MARLILWNGSGNQVEVEVIGTDTPSDAAMAIGPMLGEETYSAAPEGINGSKVVYWRSRNSEVFEKYNEVLVEKEMISRRLREAEEAWQSEATPPS